MCYRIHVELKSKKQNKSYANKGTQKSLKPKETISVKTEYGVVHHVPVINWEELTPYWTGICRAIFEVLLENDFSPYAATLKKPDGFVASTYYWKKSLRIVPIF